MTFFDSFPPIKLFRRHFALTSDCISGISVGREDMTTQTGFVTVPPHGDDIGGRVRGKARGRAAVVVVLALIGAAVGALEASRSGVPSLATPPGGANFVEEWTKVELPPMIEFERPPFGGPSWRGEVMVDKASGARRDTYTLGAFNGEKPLAYLEAWTHREGSRASLFVELAEQASLLGASITRFGAVKTMATSRGAIESADLILKGATGNRTCGGFRMASAAIGGMLGLMCSSKPELVAEDELVCFINGLTISAAGRDARLPGSVQGPPSRQGACRDGLH